MNRRCLVWTSHCLLSSLPSAQESPLRENLLPLQRPLLSHKEASLPLSWTNGNTPHYNSCVSPPVLGVTHLLMGAEHRMRDWCLSLRPTSQAQEVYLLVQFD